MVGMDVDRMCFNTGLYDSLQHRENGDQSVVNHIQQYI
jgi:hypothetical protein